MFHSSTEIRGNGVDSLSRSKVKNSRDSSVAILGMSNSGVKCNSKGNEVGHEAKRSFMNKTHLSGVVHSSHGITTSYFFLSRIYFWNLSSFSSSVFKSGKLENLFSERDIFRYSNIEWKESVEVN